MKKTYAIIALATIIAVASQAKYRWEGKGKVVTATTTAQVVTPTSDVGDYGFNCSIQNLGTETVFVQIVGKTPATTNGFNVSTAIPVNGIPFNFEGDNEKRSRKIYGAIVATESGSSSVVVTFN